MLSDLNPPAKFLAERN